MTAEFSDKGANRLLQLSDEVARIATALATLSTTRIEPPGGREDREAPDMAVGAVERAVNERKARARYFPGDLFGEPVWDMLLELLHCELRGRDSSVSDLCLYAGVPGTAALRWIAAMIERGLVTREPPPNEGSDAVVRLAPAASAALRRYFAEVAGAGRGERSRAP